MGLNRVNRLLDSVFPKLSRRGRNGYERGIDGSGIIAQLDVKYPCFGRRNRQCVFHEALRHGHGADEVGINTDGIKQKKFLAGESALLFRRLKAMDSFEFWNAHQLDEWLPVPLRAVAGNRAGGLMLGHAIDQEVSKRCPKCGAILRISGLLP